MGAVTNRVQLLERTHACSPSCRPRVDAGPIDRLRVVAQHVVDATAVCSSASTLVATTSTAAAAAASANGAAAAPFGPTLAILSSHSIVVVYARSLANSQLHRDQPDRLPSHIQHRHVHRPSDCMRCGSRPFLH